MAVGGPAAEPDEIIWEMSAEKLPLQPASVAGLTMPAGARAHEEKVIHALPARVSPGRSYPWLC
jgi:hypothetical protein